MPDAFITTARALYAFLALLLVPLGLLSLSSWFTNAPARTGADFLNMLFWPVLVVVVYLPPSVRGWWRVLRREELIPRGRWHARPGAGIVVAVSASLAVVLILLFAANLPDASRTQLLLAAVASAVALLVGEWVLVGRDE